MATSFIKEEDRFLRAVRGKVANYKVFSALRFGTGTAGITAMYCNEHSKEHQRS